MTKHIAWTLAALTALAVGCTGNGGSDGGTGTTGSSGSTGATGGTTGGTTGDAGFGLGVVNLEQQILDDGSGGTHITVLATATLSTQVAPIGCTHTDMPPSCAIIVCPAALSDGGVVSPPVTNAGIITITTSDSAATINSIDVTPIDGGYSQAVLATEFFESGDTITFSASGGPVPAFQGTLTAPAPISLIAPDVDGGPQIDRANDFSIDWDVVGPPNGQVQLTVSNGLTTARCIYDVSAGTGTIPAAVLQQVPAGAGRLTGSSLAQLTVPAGSAGSVVLNVITLGDNFVQVGLQ